MSAGEVTSESLSFMCGILMMFIIVLQVSMFKMPHDIYKLNPFMHQLIIGGYLFHCNDYIFLCIFILFSCSLPWLLIVLF